MTAEQSMGSRILIVDDDDALLRAHARILTNAGYQVETAADGNAGVSSLRQMSFDVILSDIDMPGMDGIALLEQVRTHDLDVPVVIITGTPSVETAMKAMEHGALRYLVKPVEAQLLVKITGDAVRLHQIAKAKRQAINLAGGVDKLVGDQAGLVSSFGRALDTLYMAYQPIVSRSNKTVFAYEALLRSREPSLPHPGAMLDAAERLGRIHDLSRRIRAKAIEPLQDFPKGSLLFLNLHPDDLLDATLLATDTPLAAVAPQIVLEITERASLHKIHDIQARIASLREMGFRIAIDDLGAGYAGLTSFALLQPEVAKLDMALIRDLHREPTKQKLVQTMITMCKELGIIVISEGVETAEERDEVARLGCDLMQGFLFAKPEAVPPIPRF